MSKREIFIEIYNEQNRTGPFPNSIWVSDTLDLNFIDYDEKKMNKLKKKIEQEIYNRFRTKYKISDPLEKSSLFEKNEYNNIKKINILSNQYIKLIIDNQECLIFNII